MHSDNTFDRAEYRLTSRSAVGYATEADDGTTTVLAGSVMAPDENPTLREVYSNFRRDLIQDGIALPTQDGRWILAEDIEMNSLSFAASVLSGKICARYQWESLTNEHSVADWFLME